MDRKINVNLILELRKAALSRNIDTYTESHSLFEGLWDEWLSLNLFLIAKELQLNDIVGEEVFNILSKEKRSELIGSKADFAKKAGTNL